MKSKWVAKAPPAVDGIKSFDNKKLLLPTYCEVILAGNSNILRPGHHYQKFKFHQQQEAFATHSDFISFSALPFFKFLAATFFTPGMFWLGLNQTGINNG